MVISLSRFYNSVADLYYNFELIKSLNNLNPKGLVMKRLFTCLILIVLTTHGNAQSAEPLKWMLGTWKINTGQGFVVEQWSMLNDSTFSGRSFFVKANHDTIPQEVIQLALRKGQWYYIPTVEGQNNNQPVSFPLQFIGKSEFISINPNHDFPQRIAYRRIKNQLFASIEGLKKNKYIKQNFDFSAE
jgi:Domain of unknown function (DUF6265)